MPHTKSKGQTKPRGATVPARKETRRIGSGQILRSAARTQEKEIPLRGPNAIGASQRQQAERAYAGDMTRRFDVARGKRLTTRDAERRYGRDMQPGDTLERIAKSAGRRPRKVAASTGKPRSKLGRVPVRK